MGRKPELCCKSTVCPAKNGIIEAADVVESGSIDPYLLIGISECLNGSRFCIVPGVDNRTAGQEISAQTFVPAFTTCDQE